MHTKLKSKVTVLQRLADNDYRGFSNNSRVILNVSLSDYGVLARILVKDSSFIHRLAVAKPLKDALIHDMFVIKSILEKSEKEVVR